MKKNKLIKVVTALSASVLLGIGLGMSANVQPVSAASNSSINITLPTTQVTVKGNNPTLYGFSSDNKKSEKFESGFTAVKASRFYLKLI